MQWELLTPKDFEKLAKEEKVCVLPIGTLERHGEHMPFGTDTLVPHKIAVEASKIEPCVVFPAYYFGSINEATCFSGAVNLSSNLALNLLEEICDEIGRNGFSKIVILNGHGGNSSMLEYFLKNYTTKNKKYTIYMLLAVEYLSSFTKEEMSKIIESYPNYGHACEWETSLVMSVEPTSVKLEYSNYNEPINSTNALQSLQKMHLLTGFDWHSSYPLNTMGYPSLATKEKGDKLIQNYINNFAKMLKFIKDDELAPKFQKQFTQEIKKGDK